MKSLYLSAALVLMAAAAGSTAAAQSPGSASSPAGPQPTAPPRQAQTSNATGTPGVAATNLGQIVATSNTAAYVSAEAIGRPVVFIGSDSSPYGMVGTYTNHALGFRTNNIARMFIDTNGNVGIGTATPGYKLDVDGAINSTSLFVNGVAVGAGGSQWVSGASGVISYTGGNVGIGTTSPGATMSVVNSGAPEPTVLGVPTALKVGTASGTVPLALKQNADESTTPTVAWFETAAGGLGYLGAGTAQVTNLPQFTIGAAAGRQLAFGTGGAAPSVIIDLAGNVGIGTTQPIGLLHVEDDGSGARFAAVFAHSQNAVGVAGNSTDDAGVAGNSTNGKGVWGLSTNGYAGYFSGDVFVAGTLCAANVACPSDARLKEHVRSLDYGLAHLMRLRPVRWSWIDQNQKQLPLGLIAQDVEPVIPELVMRDHNPDKPLGLNYMGLVPIMIKAIQEQQDTISKLSNENATLRRHNAALDARLTALEQTMRQVLDLSREREAPDVRVAVRER